MTTIAASPRHTRAIAAVTDLLGRQKIDFMFAGSVARAAWLGGDVTGAVDVIALMTPQQKNQVAMMASNRGFRVERAEIEQSEELDLVPLNFIDDDGDVRIHVLLASNALYGRMFADAQTVGDVRVPAAEDLALMMAVGEDEVSVRRLQALPGFDREAYRRKLVSIGMGAQAE
jgi:hypothetical protein